MRIAVDMGNSATKVALFDSEDLVELGRFPTELLTSVEELTARIGALIREGDREKIDGAVFTTVVPATRDVLAEGLRRLSGEKPLAITPSLDLGIRIGYGDPSELGADRIASVAAAYAEEGGPLVVVDLGTATTFNAVTGDGLFVGGAIAPGVLTGARAMARRTARLFETKLLFPSSVIARSTEDGIRSGVLWGAVAFVDGMVERMFEELRGGRAIATGGLGSLVCPECRTIERYDPLLTLRGLRLLYQRNRPTRPRS